MSKISYILNLRNCLQPQFRHMPLLQDGSAIIVVNDQGKILLEERTDRDYWCVPGGVQELGETFEEVALRELYEETGLTAEVNDLILIDVISGESRKNSYPNGDQVYNNTALFITNKYVGNLNCDYEELVDNVGTFEIKRESNKLEFFSLDELPSNLMDKDLIKSYRNYKLKQEEARYN